MEEKKRWIKETLEKALKRVPERKHLFKTSSDIDIEALYTPDDIQNIDYAKDTGFPGEYPFTRGVQPSMYRSRFWTMRQYAGFASAEETNRRFRMLLDYGQTGLSIAFDLPTQLGYDSDHPLCAGEVGKVGVAIDSLEDLEILFDSIPLDKVSTSMTINAPALVLLAMYIAVAEKQGVKPEVLEGTVQNDILKEYVARGTYIFPPAPSMRLTVDLIEYTSKHLPKWNPISISGYHIREAGATAAQELAFTLADGIDYVKAVIDRGLNVDSFAPRLSFFFGSHNNILEEAAKFRAARRLWARIMKEQFLAKDPKSLMLRFHTQTAGCTLTAQQPLNNIVRVTLQALAAVLGGTQSLHTNSYDEAICLPTEDAVTVALRTQQIIAHESGAADTIDPLAGSYYIESLTEELENKAKEYFDRIERMGGALKAIESGYIQKEIQNSAYTYQKQVEAKEETVVGVNDFIRESEEAGYCRLIIDLGIEKSQKERLAQLRKKRDNEKVKNSLEALRKSALSNDNLMEPVLEVVRAYATVGEICQVLRDIFGEYIEFKEI